MGIKIFVCIKNKKHYLIKPFNQEFIEIKYKKNKKNLL